MRVRTRYRTGITYLWIIVFFLSLGGILYYSDSNIRTIVCDVVINEAQSDSERIINQAVCDELDANNTKFSDIIKISYDDEKNIKAVNTDTVYLNKLKSKIIQRINDDISNYSEGTITVRMGSLFNNEFLNGRGPRIAFSYEMANNIYARYTDKFVSAGINQTKHRLMLSIKTELYIVTPLLDTSTTFTTEVLLNETVIVGSVPDSYSSFDLN